MCNSYVGRWGRHTLQRFQCRRWLAFLTAADLIGCNYAKLVGSVACQVGDAESHIVQAPKHRMLDRARLCDRFVPLAHILRKLLNLHKIKQETKDQSTLATLHSGRADSAYLQAYLERLDSRPAIAIR